MSDPKKEDSKGETERKRKEKEELDRRMDEDDEEAPPVGEQEDVNER